MYEVKVTFRFDNVVRQQTIASFDGDGGRAFYRDKAVAFAKQIDPGFSVDVVDVANENNAPMFGLVYHHDAAF